MIQQPDISVRQVGGPPRYETAENARELPQLRGPLPSVRAPSINLNQSLPTRLPTGLPTSLSQDRIAKYSAG
jgi:hypothetical protein